nr:site-specific DNA-methyltransferase [Gammaproteobacteria bacterium]
MVLAMNYNNTLIQGDALSVLKTLPEDLIHLTFTSPPYYNARDYSQYESYEKYLQFLKEVFAEVHRTTKEGRFLIINTSPVIEPRPGRNQSSKRYAIPFDLNHVVQGIGWEFIDDIVWAKREHTAKIRIGGFTQNKKPLTYKPNPLTEYLMVYRKQTNKLIDCNLEQYDKKTVADSLVDDNFERGNIWYIDPQASKLHTAVFPAELCRQVIKLYSFKGDLVFDPFGGSGTTASASIQLGRNFLTTEILPEYIKVILE